MPTPDSLLDRYVALLRAWERAHKAAQAIDRGKYPESRQLADWEVMQRQADLYEFKDSAAADLYAAMRWMRESGRYEDVLASLARDAVHDETSETTERQRAKIVSLERRVEELEKAVEFLLSEREQNEREVRPRVGAGSQSQETVAGDHRGRGNGVLRNGHG